MPQFLESILRGAAKARGFRSKKKIGQYVYGAMNNMGAMHGNQITPKGAAMEAKHTEDMSAKGAVAKPLKVKTSAPRIPHSKSSIQRATQPHPRKFPDVHGYSWRKGFQ
jgi:hypothetical protein